MAAGADVLFKTATGFDTKFVAAAFLYMLCSVPALIAFKNLDFSMVVVLWNAISVLVSIAIGVWFFKDEISFLRTVIVTLSLTAVLLSHFDAPGPVK